LAGDDLRPASARVEDLPGDLDGEVPAARGERVVVPHLGAGVGEEGRVHVDLVRAGVPVAGDERVTGPAGIAAEADQGQVIGQAQDGDVVVGFGHVVQRAGLGAQRVLDRPLLRGQAGQGRTPTRTSLHHVAVVAGRAGEAHLYRLGGRVRQVAVD